MERVIKFRAWDTNRMVIHTAAQMGIDEVSIHPDGRGFFNPHPDHTKLSEFFSALIPMQFTGHYDESGIEIYVGDIVEYCPKHLMKKKLVIAEVLWDDCFALVPNKTIYVDHKALFNAGCLKVIGNIYDAQYKHLVEKLNIEKEKRHYAKRLQR